MQNNNDEMQFQFNKDMTQSIVSEKHEFVKKKYQDEDKDVVNKLYSDLNSEIN